MENQVKQMTVEDVLKEVQDILKGIRPSMEDYEEITVPLRNAISGIKVVLDTFEKEKERVAAEKAKKEKPKKPELQLAEE